MLLLRPSFWVLILLLGVDKSHPVPVRHGHDPLKGVAPTSGNLPSPKGNDPSHHGANLNNLADESKSTAEKPAEGCFLKAGIVSCGDCSQLNNHPDDFQNAFKLVLRDTICSMPVEVLLLALPGLLVSNSTTLLLHRVFIGLLWTSQHTSGHK